MDKKEYFKTYNKKYYSEHKEKWQEYAKSEYKKRYNSMYYQANKSKYNERYKNFIKDYEGKFVYFILNKENDEILYVGETTNLYKRISLHKYNEKFDDKLHYILFLDFSNKLTEEELVDAESHFIEIFSPKINKHYGDYDTSILLKISDRDLVFKEFKLDGGKDVH